MEFASAVTLALAFIVTLFASCMLLVRTFRRVFR